MKLSHIFIKNFRNIKNKELSFGEKTILNGINGSGKTSVIEAAFISFTGKSFRTSNTKDIISKGEKYFFVKSQGVDFFGYNREFSIGLDESGTRKILIDGNVSSRKDLMNTAFPVIHMPDDMEIIKGGPKKRRDFIDRICFMENNNYFDELIEYNRYVKQKNSALKRGDSKIVHYLNLAAIPLIDKIRESREIICKKINHEFKTINQNIFPELKLHLLSHHEDNTAEKLELKINKEIEKGLTLYGPHLDVVSVKTDLGDSRTNISMGETYLISLVLKISELSLYSKKGLYPVFFIDDLFVFLDKNRKNSLYEIISGLKNQVIMTSSTETTCDFEQISFQKLV